MCQFSGKISNFDFLGPNLPKNGFWGKNFKNLRLNSKSGPPRYHACQFLVKMDNFEFFSLNLGKLPNYVRYFRSNIVEGAAESWVDTEMSWVEVDGAGWRWVHGLVIPLIKSLVQKVESLSVRYIPLGTVYMKSRIRRGTRQWAESEPDSHFLVNF